MVDVLMLRVYAIHSQTILMKRVLIVMAVVELGLFSVGWDVSSNTSTLVDVLLIGEPYICRSQRCMEILILLIFSLVPSWRANRS